MQSTWVEAHSVALRAYLDKGLSFAEIARALNQQFGTIYTRNAAIGRARRMGLSVPLPPPSDSVMGSPKRPDARRICQSRTRKLNHVPPKPSTSKPSKLKPSTLKTCTFERAEALQLRCVAMTPRHLFAGRSRGERLPLSLWRRRRGRPHHLLRPPAPRGFELLPVAFSSDEPAGSRHGACRARQNSAAARGGGMSGEADSKSARLKRLPPRLRVAPSPE